MSFETFEFARKNFQAIRNYAAFLPNSQQNEYDEATLQKKKTHTYCNITQNETTRRQCMSECLTLVGISTPNVLALPNESTFIDATTFETHGEQLCKKTKQSADARNSRKRNGRGKDKTPGQIAAGWLSKELTALFGTKLRKGKNVNGVDGYWYEADSRIVQLAKDGNLHSTFIVVMVVTRSNKSWTRFVNNVKNKELHNKKIKFFIQHKRQPLIWVPIVHLS